MDFYGMETGAGTSKGKEKEIYKSPKDKGIGDTKDSINPVKQPLQGFFPTIKKESNDPDRTDTEDWNVPMNRYTLRNIFPTRNELLKACSIKPVGWQEINDTPWRRWSKVTQQWLNRRGLLWCIQSNVEATNIQDQFEMEIVLDAIAMLAGKKEDMEVLDAGTLYLAWEKLQSRYAHKSMLNAQTLELQLESITYKGEPIATWFDDIVNIRKELSEINDEFAMSDRALINKMFRVLPDEFRVELSILRKEIMKGSCNLDDICQSLMDAEIEINRTHKMQSISSINISQKSQTYIPKPQYNRNSIQTNLKYRNYKTQNQKLKFNGNCYECGKHGHRGKDCRSRSDKPNKHISIKENHTQLFIGATVLAGTCENEDLVTIAGETWILDSGATHHVTGNSNVLQDMQEIQNKQIFMGNNGQLQVTHSGQAKIQLDNGHCLLENVLYVPELVVNLISVPCLVNRGLNVNFGPAFAYITKDKQLVTRARKIGNLYFMGKIPPSIAHTHFIGASIDVWHRRLGHLNKKDLQSMPTVVDGMEISNIKPNIGKELCQGCEFGKQTRTPFGTDYRRTNTALELIHSDLMEFPDFAHGLSPAHIKDKWVATFIDDYSRYVTIYIFNTKDKVCSVFMEFKAYYENKLNQRIKTLRTDGGMEYMGLKQFLIDQGIEHQITSPYTPQQNGIAERMNRTLAEMMRAMMYQYKEPINRDMWGHALLMAAQIRNICPTYTKLKITNNNHGKSPYEILFSKRPNINFLRTFGCKVFFHIPDATRNKLDPKSKIGMLIGVQMELRKYKVWEPINDKIYMVRDIKFDESHTIIIKEGMIINIPLAVEATQIRDENIQSDSEIENDQIDELEDTTLESDTTSEIDNSGLRRSARERKLPEKLRDNVIYNMSGLQLQILEPTTYQQAIESNYQDEWIEAMKNELDVHMKLGTWKPIDQIPEGRRQISSKWHYRIKRHANGSIAKFKARLVARGFTQVEGEDYTETFAPVVKFKTLRILLALATIYKWEIHQIDVVTAYLNGQLQEEIYMSPPPGMDIMLHEMGYKTKQNTTLKLQLALYGLKQSGRTWYKTLDKTLTEELLLQRSVEDECVYFNLGAIKIIIAVYVDDLLILAEDQKLIQKIKNLLTSKFKMTDNGKLNWMLGLEVSRKLDQTEIKQTLYARTVLERFGMLECIPAPTPLPAGCLQAEIPRNEVLADKQKYQQIIGSLMYLMVGTRPDLAFAVSYLSRFSASPTMTHWKLARHVMRYVKGTLHYGIHFEGKTNQNLIGYCDADFASDRIDRRSFTGYVFTLANAAIAWKLKKQSTVAMSTMESEYMSLASATSEAIWLKRFLKELKVSTLLKNEKVPIFTDNMASLALAKNPVHHDRAKHIDIKYHRIREEITKGTVEINHLPGTQMVADILTKPLDGPVHRRHRESMGVKAPYDDATMDWKKRGAVENRPISPNQ